MTSIRIVTKPVAFFREPARNPNAMAPDDYALLVHGIRTAGFLQPILAHEDGEIVDGVHRWRAAKEAGLDSIPAVVGAFTPARASLLQLALNRLRGELNLGAVAAQLADLRADGIAPEELILSGFGEDEIDDLCRLITSSSDDVLADGISDAGSEPSEPGAFILELHFDTAEDLRRAKRALRKAGGKGAPLERGLFRLIEGS